MFSVFIIADESEMIKELQSGLASGGFACSFTSDREKAIEQVVEQAPDLVLVEMDGRSTTSSIRGLSRMIKSEKRLPIMALIGEEMLNSPDNDLDIDDFIIKPCDVRELVLRAKRLMQRANGRGTEELIECGDLVIDLAKCEVSIEDRLVMLTFKEYELLKFLASHRGRVFTREAVLNKVWGYDYYGGDRTVDVHVRRLRSKIEDSGHTFIETVRNIGYRFKGNI